MSTLPSIAFEKLSNGGSDSFPLNADLIAALDDYPDLIHIGTMEKSDQNFLQLSTFKNGKRCVIFKTETSKNPAICIGDRKSITFMDKESRLGTFISYENGSFKTGSVALPADTWTYIHSANADYFILKNPDNGYSLVSSKSDKHLITWKFSGCKCFFVHFYNDNFILFACYQGRCIITKYELVNDEYCAVDQISVPFEPVLFAVLGDHYVAFMGSGHLAIFDCATTKVERFTFPQVTGDMHWMTAPVVYNNLAEIFFSVANKEATSVQQASKTVSKDTIFEKFSKKILRKPTVVSNADCNIYKATLSLCELAERFEMQTHNRNTHNLPYQLSDSEFFERNAIQQKYAALSKANEENEKNIVLFSKENEENKKKITELEDALASLCDRGQEHENVRVELQDGPIGSSALARFEALEKKYEALEKKYSNVLMLISKK